MINTLNFSVMKFKVVKSKAVGPKDDPVIISSETIDSNVDFVDASDSMYYEVLGFKKSGAQVLESNLRAVIVDSSDRATHVIDIFEE